MARVNLDGRMRDSQRSKVYEAEKGLDAFYGPRLSWEATQAFARRVVRESKSWGNWDTGARWIEVRDGRGRSNAGGCSRYIAMPRWSRTRLVIIHELAHTCQHRSRYPYEDAAHGPVFARIYLDLVEEFLGREVSSELALAFRKCKVRVWPPHWAKGRFAEAVAACRNGRKPRL